MDEQYLPDWDENQLSLGRTSCMNTPTYIEWVERELETPEETKTRHEAMWEMHQLWHNANPGACKRCGLPGQIVIKSKTLSPNEIRDIQERFQIAYATGQSVMYLPEGVSVEMLPTTNPSM